MRGDIEGKIVKQVNEQHNKNFKLKDLMEWSTSEESVKKNLREGEIMLKCDYYGCWCAFKEAK